jgi:signal transduction histidine kinase
MPLRLKTKFTLTTALLALAVAAVVSAAYVASLTSGVVAETNDRARFIAQIIFLQTHHAIEDAAAEGRAPASESADDMREFVREAMEDHAGLTSTIDAVVGYSPVIYEVAIVDHRGIVLIASDASLPGRLAPRREDLGALANAGILEQLGALRGPTRVFQHRLAFDVGDDPFGDIRVAFSSSFLYRQIEPRLLAGLWLALAAVLVSTALAGAVSHFALAPLAKISAQLDSLAKGEFEAGAAGEAVHRRDELGQVSSKIGLIRRQMQEQTSRSREERSLERIQAQIQLLERVAALGRVTAGAAHEVKNPLNSMRLWLENLKAALPAGPGEHSEALRILDAEIDRLDGVVKRLLDFYRPVELEPEETSLAELLEETLAVVRPQAERAGIAVENSLPRDVPAVRVDVGLIKQAVLNLLVNAIEAIEATGGGGRLTLSLERADGSAVIRVADTGRGIPPEHREKIFRLFFTTRPGGSGMGLASVFKTVQLHGGSVDFTSEVGRGTTFRIELPLAA